MSETQQVQQDAPSPEPCLNCGSEDTKGGEAISTPRIRGVVCRKCLKLITVRW